MAETIDTVIQVNIYPFKSCQAATVNGERPQALSVGPTGFQVFDIHDREFVLYDPAEQNMVTQRGWNVAGTKVVHPEDRVLATTQINTQYDHLEITTPGFGRIDIAAQPEEGERSSIGIFGKELPVVKQRAELAAYFSRLLGRELEVYRADREQPRLLPAQYRQSGAANRVAGADGFPFLLTSLASLTSQHRRNAMEAGTVPMSVYRSNIVIGGYAIGAFMEDKVELMQIGEMPAVVAKACARCPIPNIDQETGERDGGGMKVLRGRAGVGANGSKGVFFGQNLNHVYSPGQIVAAFDEVRILSVADRPNVQLRAT
jgi:uncharacterized protein YcbX